MVPEYRNRTPHEIVSHHIFHDAIGFGLRAASWLDYVDRSGDTAALYYACIDGRLSIEHLMFELIVICSEPRLTVKDYQRCVNSPRKLDKLISRMVPEYEKVIEFSIIIQQITPGVPPINKWDIKKLRKDWGSLSSYLHWTGAASRTTENFSWQGAALQTVKAIIIPLWEKLGSGRSGAIQIESMPDNTRDVWEKFRKGDLDSEQARLRMEMLGP